MARKGYKSIEEQLEADRRYLKNNPAAKEKKKISTLRSQAKRYVREYMSIEEYGDFIQLMDSRIDKLEREWL